MGTNSNRLSTEAKQVLNITKDDALLVINISWQVSEGCVS